MKIEAKNVDQLITKTTKNQELLINLLKITKKKTKLEPYLFEADSISMIAFGKFYYQNSYYQGDYPLIGIAPQKNYIGVYVMATGQDGKYFIEKFSNEFKKSNVGKSCIRFKNLDAQKISAYQQVLDIAMKWYQKVDK